MFGRKVSINHRHFYICVTQNIAQYEYVSAVHHKMAGECMAQNVGTLTLWQINTCSLHCSLEGFSAWGEQPPSIFGEFIVQFMGYRYGSVFLAFGFGIGDPVFR